MAAQGTASTALTNAATAQTTANTGVADAAAAQGTANTALALGQSSVQYENASHTSVTLDPGGAAATLHNVAAGVAPTDAADVGQVRQASASTLGAADAYTDNKSAATLASANAYTDLRFGQVDASLTALERRANASTAAALASSYIPRSTEPGKGLVGAGIGYWEGRSALAAGLSRHMENGWTVKFSATVAFHGAAGGSAGAGYEF